MADRGSRPLSVLNVVLIALGVAVACAWVFATGGFDVLSAARLETPSLLPLLVVGSLTSMGVRFVRWQYLLRRADVRVPARRSLSIYLASLLGTATPAYLGEVVRGLFLKRRFGVPLRVSVSVIVTERLFDVAALVLIGLATAHDQETALLLVIFLVAAVAVGGLVAETGRAAGVPERLFRRMVTPGAFAKSLILSLMVWCPASLLVTVAAHTAGEPVGVGEGMHVFATSTLFGGVTLMPAGIAATGSAAISQLTASDLSLAAGVLIVTLVRLATTGLWLSVSTVFMALEVRDARRTDAVGSTAHFNEVAGEYDQQFSEHVWNHLIARKMDMVAQAVGDRGRGDHSAPGLDLGCGLGQQVRSLRERGYHVFGIDAAEGLVRRAHDAGLPALAGSALALPFGDATLDFVYVVGVMHHLPDTAAQEAACREILRVLRPGGRLVVHETNPRNPLFSFYMGYVFPILKTIDEGTEWWIEPTRWERRDDFRHVETRWFTFLPDFIPRVLMPPFKLLERLLENSPLRGWSVHYMAVLEKPCPA